MTAREVQAVPGAGAPAARRVGLPARIRRWCSGLLDAAVPQTCVACGAWIPGDGPSACPPCHAEMTAGLSRPYCPRCGRTLPTPAIHDDGCARCEHEPFWNVAGVVRVGLYTPKLRATLVRVKYGGVERGADYLAELLARALAAHPDRAHIRALVPVPMHWQRRIQRPCDHTHLLAAALSRQLHVPVVRMVRRQRHRPSQTVMTGRMARFENVREAFAPSWQWTLWRRLHAFDKRDAVVIVDNLLASGATVHEVSKVLRKAGAKRILAAVVARPAAPGDPWLSPDALIGTPG
jgi:ComF family protein